MSLPTVSSPSFLRPRSGAAAPAAPAPDSTSAAHSATEIHLRMLCSPLRRVGSLAAHPSEGPCPSPPRGLALRASRDGRQDRDLLAVGHRRVDALAEPDVLAAHEHVDEPPQRPVLHHPLAEAAVAGLDLVDELPDGPRVAVEGR